MTAAKRMDAAIEVIERYGMIDGAHHKQWVMDQVVRALLGEPGYAEWVADYNSQEDYAPWDPGIAP